MQKLANIYVEKVKSLLYNRSTTFYEKGDSMDTIKFDLSKKYGEFKPMNAVNNGPVYKRHASDQWRTNIKEFTDAKIPYVRNHDAAFCGDYGSEHTVDITAVFPDFSADPNLEDSYDFACTDEYIHVTNLTGAKTFYRLGQKIEHYVKKFGTIPPVDFKKWAVVCEHIIRHYTEGWANGYNFDMEYWEIWNEPDLDPDDCDNKRTWGGTQAEFFDFYEIASKHLKGCFPDLKIGGPALAHDYEWAEAFLKEMNKRNVPIDFFSWHIYCAEPREMVARANVMKKLLTENGYEKAESILNEWNYVKGWTDEFVYSIESIIGMKGATFTMACMSEAQKSTIDMLMYYDARPCAFNGLFDFYTLRPLKGYYPFLWFSYFANLEEVRSENTAENIYTLCGVDGDGKVTAVVTYYSDNGDAENKQVRLDFGKDGKYEVYMLDKEHNAELVETVSEPVFDMCVQSCVMIKEI